MKNIILIIVFFISSIIQAQQTGSPMQNANASYIINDYISKAERNGANSVNTNKDFLLFKKWKSVGKLSIKGKQFTVKNMNINIQTNELLYQTHKDSIFSIPYNSDLDFCIIKNKKFKYKFYDGENKLFEVLSSGKRISLLKRYFIKISQREDVGLGRSKEIVKKKHQYFVLKEKEGVLTKVKLKKKDFVNLVDNDFQKKIKKYAKENKLSFRKEKGVKKILEFYNRN